ncbi:MAG: endonuclease/exonuclease/phosphatase family protein [Bacteroidales bacterium]|nr:endonuclease/exonuclease/phosphatase family protein [Bacteroidales bacterium]
MRKTILYGMLTALVLWAALAAPASAQRGGRSYVIGFYNLENLFDTYHDEGKNDYEYLPDGANQWTEAKYVKKLHNMATVIRAIHDDNKVWHAVLGVSEIENRHVLEDLVMQPEIAEANFQIVHYDGPDRRGVDVALLYRPSVFQVLESRSIPFTFAADSKVKFSLTKEEQDDFRTRDILMVRGLLGGEMFAFFVAHLPSRTGGKGGDLRSRGGEIMYEEAMKLQAQYPGIKIVAMGDMNDNPTDDSMAVYMRAKEKIADVGPKDFFSPFLSMYKAGYGSLAYQGEWNIYDIIVVNSNLVNARQGSLGLIPIVKDKYYGRVFHKPFMTQQEGDYKGTPFRTSSGGAFINGYSDHYPTYIVVSTKHAAR